MDSSLLIHLVAFDCKSGDEEIALAVTFRKPVLGLAPMWREYNLWRYMCLRRGSEGSSSGSSRGIGLGRRRRGNGSVRALLFPCVWAVLDIV